MNDPLKLVNTLPNVISIEITTRCPLKCIYCYRKEFITHDRDLPLEEFPQLKNWLARIPGLRRVNFCGIGESLCHRDFYRIVEELDAYRISLVTSGTVPIDFDKLNHKRNLDTVIFSIDATTLTLMEQVCPGISYNNVIANLDKMVKHTQLLKTEGKKIILTLNCTINQLNIAEIPLVMDFAARYHFKAVHYSLPWGKEEFVSENRQQLQSLFAEAQAMARKHGIYTDDPFRSFCCIFLESIMPYISVNGDVFACGGGFNKGHVVGNYHKQDFLDMWSNAGYDEFKNSYLCGHCTLSRYANMPNL